MAGERAAPRDHESPKDRLSERSDEILQAVDDLRQMEAQKRSEPISTPEFHRLAEDITRKSRDVFRIALDEEQLGDESARGPETIDDIDRGRSGP